MDKAVVSTKELREKRYLSVIEAAQYLSIPQNTLRAWLRMKRVPCLKVVGRVLFDREVLEAWLKARSVPADSIGPGDTESDR